MRLEKVVQSLIKGPTLTSEASPYFTILVIVKMDSSSIKICTLLDFWGLCVLINKDFANRHKLPLVIKNILSLWKLLIEDL